MGLGMPTLGYLRWWGPCISMWTLTTHFALSQVKIYGAGRSRIPQALVHRPETLSYHGPETKKRNNCLLSSIWREPSLPYLKPQPGPFSSQARGQGLQ